MISGPVHSQPSSFADLLSLKSAARDKQVSAVYAADFASLELAGQRAKAALRGNSEAIARPRRFSALSNCN